MTALRLMHKYGWVHRDVSSGNILVVDGVVKISDLEYAKKMGDETSHNGRSVRFAPLFVFRTMALINARRVLHYSCLLRHGGMAICFIPK